jgi:hypothetical protein
MTTNLAPSGKTAINGCSTANISDLEAIHDLVDEHGEPQLLRSTPAPLKTVYPQRTKRAIPGIADMRASSPSRGLSKRPMAAAAFDSRLVQG